MENNKSNSSYWLFWLFGALLTILILGWLFRNNESSLNTELGQDQEIEKQELISFKGIKKRKKYRLARR